MKLLYLDCGMGIAGDMLLGALTELLPSKEAFVEKINGLNIPHVKVCAEESIKCGIAGTHIQVTVNGQEEKSCDIHSHYHEHPEHHSHEHEHIGNDSHSHEHGHIENDGHRHKHEHIENDGHSHEHEHTQNHNHSSHHHANLEDIGMLVDKLALSEEIKKDVMGIYQLIAQAESEVHGMEVSKVHFHEVGMMDAVADITGCVLAIHELKPDKIIASSVNTGYGKVRCAHGILPVPAPAAARILRNIPCYGGQIEGELCTPTGAALLKYFATGYSAMPPMSIEKIGYGMGNKDFEAANCVRAILGETQEAADEVIELCCNIDDMTAEEAGYALELFLKNGALEAYTTPVGMKKSRPGILLSVMCREEKRKDMAALIFKHTTTIGIREYRCNRMVLKRQERTIDTPFGLVRAKEATGFGVTKEKLEYEDLKKIAEETNLSIGEIKERIKTGRINDKERKV